MALGLMSDAVCYPSIPQELVRYLDTCMKNQITNRFTMALADAPEVTVQAIDEMFRIASSATGLTPDALLRATDFNGNDLDETRLTAAFAEIRSINFLHQEKFTHIRPIKAGVKKSCDILAKRGDLDYAVEVAESIYDARRRFSPQQIAGWMVARLIEDGKLIQLNTTARDLVNARRVFIGVVDTGATVALQTHGEYSQAVRLAWQEAGSDPLLHLCIVTGRVELKCGPDDSTFPPWV